MTTPMEHGISPGAPRAALDHVIGKGYEAMPPSSRSPRRDEVRRRTHDPGSLPARDAMGLLREVQAAHPIWQNRLFRACAAGHLSRDDFRLVFSQYYLYSKNFTRYLAALMASCDSDYFRARLAENLWEEGGGAAPEARHAEIFRRFLKNGLGIDVDSIDYLDSTRFFAREYLDFCLHAHPSAASAFLSLGTEAIVPRMYTILMDGLLKAGVPEADTEFFRIHIACDDAHAATLEELVASYALMPGWFDTCREAMNHALDLRCRFFEMLYEAIEVQRVRGLLDRIQARTSLAPSPLDPKALHYRMGEPGAPLYRNESPAHDIDFRVERVPFKAEVFDARVLRVAPGRNNERHKHPHESLFYVVSGEGQVTVDGAALDVRAGDVVFVPRWSMHQSRCTGSEELLILAITDFGLTDRAFVGNHLKTTRLKGEQAPREP